ncbi:coiled-coil domain-containing protein 33 [Clarias magur]|uniref:Coiled-coil domain-containing protein 33 n=1 Tax=Clarias magur TaxID=1594786 RepID=A0A8J4UBB6_CLAMG|nr:coiled-coil domain-containing protein 33 [Clarias magur]
MAGFEADRRGGNPGKGQIEGFKPTGTEEDRTGRWRSQAVTRCALQSTHNPFWQENLSVEHMDVEGHREGMLIESGDNGATSSQTDVVINIADGPSKEVLAHFWMPSSYLQPFRHQDQVQLSVTNQSPQSRGDVSLHMIGLLCASLHSFPAPGLANSTT